MTSFVVGGRIKQSKGWIAVSCLALVLCLLFTFLIFDRPMIEQRRAVLVQKKTEATNAVTSVFANSVFVLCRASPRCPTSPTGSGGSTQPRTPSEVPW